MHNITETLKAIRMKLKILILALMMLTNFCLAQSLQTGHYTYDTLISLNLSMAQVYDSTCPPVEELNLHDCWPYVTGVNVFLRIDSVIGPTNSVRLWNYSGVLHPGDTFSLSTYSFYNFFYYSPVTFYVSLIAAGTPLISGQSYCCYYIYEGGIIIDGCGGYSFDVLPGDTSKNCYVDSIASSISLINSFKDIIYYPNPASDKITIEYSDRKNINLFIYNIYGQLLQQKELDKNKNEIDINSLAIGTYIIKLKGTTWTAQEKLIKK